MEGERGICTLTRLWSLTVIMSSTFKVQIPLFGDVVILGLDARTLEPRVRLGHVSFESRVMLRLYDDFKEEISAHCRSP